MILAPMTVLAACATSQRLIGTPRSPLPPSAVQVYLEPISRTYREIAVLDCSSKRSLAFTADAKTEVVVERLTAAAAKLGANGILLQEIADGAPDSLATGVVTDHDSNHGSISLGIGWQGRPGAKYGRAIAVFVE